MLVVECGFEIIMVVGGLDMVFCVDYGSGLLVVGVCVEYDVFFGIGYVCGYNIIVVFVVGIVLVLVEVVDDLGLIVVLLGIFVEEFGGGKVLML